MDQATIMTYAAGYLAAIFGVFLIYLPLLIGIGLLLALTGVASLVVVLVKLMTVGLYRFLVRELRTPTARLHGGGGPGGQQLAPH
jgi:hypothetical protein